jgi:hypothetical protein
MHPFSSQIRLAKFIAAIPKILKKILTEAVKN